MSKAKTQKKLDNRIAQVASRRSRTKIFRGVTASVIILLFGAILYLTLGEAFHNSDSQILTKDNLDAILDQLNGSSDPSDISFEAIMNYTWQFPTGDAVSPNAYVENSPSNQNEFYFTVSLSDSSRTTLYVSPNLAAGDVLHAIKLDKALAAGSYDAALTYYLLDDSNHVTDTVNMAITIVVEQ